ncbi:hypothetical protein HU200_032491 [Digitaria exilis]|uniref:Uncharacterized protein n=1 Tax=Digitaria exilis TaxID=1010633 RepID=A0A835BKW4_9POAL|nr:hypothetical protein HU200_032491 [Digitaria exilis]
MTPGKRRPDYAAGEVSEASPALDMARPSRSYYDPTAPEQRAPQAHLRCRALESSGPEQDSPTAPHLPTTVHRRGDRKHKSQRSAWLGEPVFFPFSFPSVGRARSADEAAAVVYLSVTEWLGAWDGWIMDGRGRRYGIARWRKRAQITGTAATLTHSSLSSHSKPPARERDESNQNTSRSPNDPPPPPSPHLPPMSALLPSKTHRLSLSPGSSSSGHQEAVRGFGLRVAAMEGAWRKVRKALGLRVCVQAPAVGGGRSVRRAAAGGAGVCRRDAAVAIAAAGESRTSSPAAGALRRAKSGGRSSSSSLSSKVRLRL